MLELVDEEDVCKKGRIVGIVKHPRTSMEYKSEWKYKTLIDKSGIFVEEFSEYNIDNFVSIPERSGVYILYRDDNQRYIGSSFNVGKRIKCRTYAQADKIKHGKVNGVEMFVTHGRNDARKLERFLIAELDPELNFCSEIYGKLR